MKILLIAENSQLYSSKRLMDEVEILGHTPLHLNPYQASLGLGVSAIRKEEVDIVLHRSTGIRFDDFDLMLSETYQDDGAVIINPLTTLRQLRDKLSQHHFFRREKLTCLPSIGLRGKIDREELEPVINHFSELAGADRFILKTERGNKGIGVNLLESKRSLWGMLETFWGMQDQRFILQPYVPGEEYRVLIIGNEISGIIHKQNGSDDYRKNANRAEGVYLSPQDAPEDVLKLALDCYKRSGAVITGIDIMKTKSHSYLLECNLVPGFELMEKLSKKNHAREIVQISLNEVNNKRK